MNGSEFLARAIILHLQQIITTRKKRHALLSLEPRGVCAYIYMPVVNCCVLVGAGGEKTRPFLGLFVLGGSGRRTKHTEIPAREAANEPLPNDAVDNEHTINTSARNARKTQKPRQLNLRYNIDKRKIVAITYDFDNRYQNDLNTCTSNLFSFNIRKKKNKTRGRQGNEL